MADTAHYIGVGVDNHTFGTWIDVETHKVPKRQMWK